MNLDYYYEYDDEETLDYYEEPLFNADGPSLSETATNCLLPTLQQISRYIGILIGWNLLFRLGWSLVQRTRFSGQEHVISLLCGWGLLHFSTDSSFICMVLPGVVLYGFLKLLIIRNCSHLGYIVGATCIVLLSVCELFLANPIMWHKTRGMQMVMIMKVISLAFDLESKKLEKRPTFVKFMGYLYCPANTVLGPWISYQEYLAIFNTARKNTTWTRWIVTNTAVCIAFLLLSNCFTSMLCTDDSWKWLVAYRNAFSFRCSHYFISYLSQATMAASGAVAGMHEKTELSPYFGYVTTKPTSIELPRSLAQVVVNWNIPMHLWLKTYVFKTVRPYSAAAAIFTTYLMSSLLHGLHFQIYAVLLSLGVYTFVEYNLRLKVATAFNACILATRCKANCQHEHRGGSFFVVVLNGIFSMFAIFHLIYLGVMFDINSAQEEGYSLGYAISKWKSLDFLSHGVVFLSYLFYLVI